MTDTEDPNIATLREALDDVLQFGRTRNARAEGIARVVEAFETTLAERDRRIAARDKWIEDLETSLALRSAEADEMATELEALKAPPAPAPGELAAGIEFCKRPGSGVPTNVIEAAESWQRLQWRPASEAPTKWCRALVRGPLYGDRFAVCTFDPALGWMSGTDYTKVTHYILEDDLRDALPALNGGDDNV